jgi:hypothetical protein
MPIITISRGTMSGAMAARAPASSSIICTHSMVAPAAVLTAKSWCSALPTLETARGPAS